MIRFLDLLSDFLIRFFEDIVRYLGRLIPAAWRSLVSASPLFCLVWLSYVLLGERAALLTAALTVMVFAGGVIWAGKRRHAGEVTLSLRVVAAVLALNVIVIGLGLFAVYRRSKERTASAATIVYSPPIAEPVDNTLIPKQSEKATIFAKAVSRALAVTEGDYRDFDVRLLEHSLKELRAMSALKAIEGDDVISTLRYCKRSDLRSERQKACAVVAPILIQVTADSELEAYCQILYEIQADGRSFETESRAASKKLCGE